MNWSDWYTDTVDIWRTISAEDGTLTRKERVQIAEAVPCRIYQAEEKAMQMQQTAAKMQQENSLACDNAVDIRAGDELFLHRGGRLGKETSAIRAFAGEPHYYFEPFGAVMPGLAHQEVRLLQQERVK